MKKKLLVAVLLLSVLLGGCSGSKNVDFTTEENTDAWEDDTEYDDSYGDGYGDEDDSEEAVVASYPLRKIYPFSEDRAWVVFGEDEYSSSSGIIDKDGRLVYQAGSKWYYVSQFQDGFSFYRENDTEESPCGIIDSDGNTVFKSQITLEGGYLILAYGNGHFFVAQHIQNFDTDEWRYGTIDKDGNVLNEMKPCEESFGFSNIRYIGGNFISTPSVLYNISTSRFFYPSGEIADFCEAEGYTYIMLEALFDEALCIVDTNFEGLSRNENDELQGYVSIKHGLYAASGYSEGLIYGYREEDYNDYEEDAVSGYYDKDLNLVISLEQYAENDIIGGAFHGGYAAVKMYGADGECYASVIDKQGNLVYPQIKTDDIDVNNSANGYLQATIDNEKKIIGPDGTVYTPGVDDLSVLAGLTFGDVSNGFLLMGTDESDSSDEAPYYVNLDGNTVIDSVKVTSSSMAADGEEAWEDGSKEDLEEDVTSYIVPDSYDIMGKWKNIGESGFGQAQPGAVIVFDENRCNFYSPNDTYAFSFDGEKYVLALTTPLGESLEKTVDIIDDDNIEIAGTSLKRIE